MMRILFCNIAWMKEYRGNKDGKDASEEDSRLQDYHMRLVKQIDEYDGEIGLTSTLSNEVTYYGKRIR